MIFEMLCTLIMSYPSLIDSVYYENANDFDPGISFYTNDFLLCLMIFARVIYLIRAIIKLTYYSEPRAQRVCNIYGCDANNMFAFKAVMKESSWKVLISGLMISLTMLSY